jgi:hypothetical protein
LKTYDKEVKRVTAMRHGNGLIEAQLDALVIPAAAQDARAPATRLSMSEETARVLLLLLKAQLAEVDKRKGRSQR